jgi:hypothetical protein
MFATVSPLAKAWRLAFAADLEAGRADPVWAFDHV